MRSLGGGVSLAQNSQMPQSGEDPQDKAVLSLRNLNDDLRDHGSKGNDQPSLSCTLRAQGKSTQNAPSTKNCSLDPVYAGTTFTEKNEISAQNQNTVRPNQTSSVQTSSLEMSNELGRDSCCLEFDFKPYLIPTNSGERGSRQTQFPR